MKQCTDSHAAAASRLRKRYWLANSFIIIIGISLFALSFLPSLNNSPAWRSSLRTVGLAAGLFVVENFVLYEFGVYNLTVRRPTADTVG
jgi:hypothetical protein